MQIHGLNKTTLLDYPEHVAATVFCGGCNFRCPFCHNSELVLNPGSQPVISKQEILNFLAKRKGILQGVCITGGEPTLQPDLAEFIYQVKAMGYSVKLDTNGFKPEVLMRLVDGHLLDYIAMDIKSGPSGYGKAAGLLELSGETGGVLFGNASMESFMENIRQSIDFIMESGVQYEFRTTVVKGLHEKKDFQEIGPLIKGCRAYFLQNYKDSENVMQSGFSGFTKEEMEEYAEIVRPYVQLVQLRGMD